MSQNGSIKEKPKRIRTSHVCPGLRIQRPRPVRVLHASKRPLLKMFPETQEHLSGLRILNISQRQQLGCEDPFSRRRDQLLNPPAPERSFSTCSLSPPLEARRRMKTPTVRSSKISSRQPKTRSGFSGFPKRSTYQKGREASEAPAHLPSHWRVAALKENEEPLPFGRGTSPQRLSESSDFDINWLHFDPEDEVAITGYRDLH